MATTIGLRINIPWYRGASEGIMGKTGKSNAVFYRFMKLWRGDIRKTTDVGSVKLAVKNSDD